MSRYDGKPFLRLLDCYVLSSIGHLAEAQDHALSMLAPNMAKALNAQGSWFDLVAMQMDFPPTLPNQIKNIWEAGKARATEQGLSVDPREFAQQFVDKNFPTQ